MISNPMSLIWAEGMTGDKALAPVLRRYHLAAERLKDKSLNHTDLGLAYQEKEKAQAIYEELTIEAENKLKDAAKKNEPRTHMLIVGVGRYIDKNIQSVTTSIHGATAFAEWALNRFVHLDRPLGSVAMLLSLPDEMPTWKPTYSITTKLCLNSGEDLPLDTATFNNIESAFKSMVYRACTSLDNALVFYFAGHGLWKFNPYILSEDASYAGFDNLIDPKGTLALMLNKPPKTQLFFIDACQELSPSLIEDLKPSSGKPLWNDTTGAYVKRDSKIYYSSFPGEEVGGDKNKPPFFTQQLLECLEKRSARDQVGNYWATTSTSLRFAVEAAKDRINELSQQEMCSFQLIPDRDDYETVICHVDTKPSEIFVRVKCQPIDYMANIIPYIIDQNGNQEKREVSKNTDWVTTVDNSEYTVGANPIPSFCQKISSQSVKFFPPVEVVTLVVYKEIGS